MSDTPEPGLDGGLPATFYADLKTPLTLAHIVCHHIFAHPKSAFTAEVADLTGLDPEFVDTIHQVHDNATLAAVMLGQPESFLWYVRLGSQLLHTDFSRQVLNRVQPHLLTAPEADQHTAQVALSFFMRQLDHLTTYFADHLAQQDPDVAQELSLGGLQLEGILARQLGTLPPLAVPAGLTADEAEEEEPAEANLTLQDAQLHVMRLATTLVPEILLDLSQEPFARAAAAIPAFQLPQLRQLRGKLMAVAPEEPQGYTFTELLLLLRCLQVCSMAMLVPDLESFFATPAADDQDKDDTMSAIRHMTGIIVSGFVELMRENYGEEPEFAQAQQDIGPLADLL